MRTLKKLVLAAATFAALGSVAGVASAGVTSPRDPFTDGGHSMEARDPYTDGGRSRASQADARVLSARAGKFDPFTDGARSTDSPRDPFTDGGNYAPQDAETTVA
ncbi:hypothetical protein BJN34_21385 [Cupriavidus necator]|uniref:Hydroxyquinol 1,2-dioxygenase n=1 Tax=Cupriavidus necator TaxID=106590 RepID=A0A1U9UUQ4_CUPNE|nr:hypothetical protein [Cupriavidus necator]AQV96424.1 hypothetical protein BJN34_21385 [Cupriavidus necator]